MRPTLRFHASHCWGLPPSSCSPNAASGSFREALFGVGMGGAHQGAKWEVLQWRGLSEAIFAPAVPAWHRTIHGSVNCRNYGKLRSSNIVITP
jgi:hypothetical protein